MNIREKIEKCESELIEQGLYREVAKWVCVGEKLSKEEDYFDFETDLENRKRNRRKDH